MRNILKIFVILSLLWVGSSCSKSQDYSSVLEISDCELPCWLNFLVGSTNEKSALELISNNNTIVPASVVIMNKPYLIYEDEIRFSLFEDWGEINRVGVNMYLKNSMISLIHMNGALGFSVEDAMEKIGPPEYVNLSWVRPGNIDVNYVFPDLGIHMISSVESEMSEIHRGDQIHTMNIFIPNDYPDLLITGLFHNGFYNPEEIINYQWVGFGKIEYTYWPPYSE